MRKGASMHLVWRLNSRKVECTTRGKGTEALMRKNLKCLLSTFQIKGSKFRTALKNVCAGISISIFQVARCCTEVYGSVNASVVISSFHFSISDELMLLTPESQAWSLQVSYTGWPAWFGNTGTNSLGPIPKSLHNAVTEIVFSLCGLHLIKYNNVFPHKSYFHQLKCSRSII